MDGSSGCETTSRFSAIHYHQTHFDKGFRRAHPYSPYLVKCGTWRTESIELSHGHLQDPVPSIGFGTLKLFQVSFQDVGILRSNGKAVSCSSRIRVNWAFGLPSDVLGNDADCMSIVKGSGMRVIVLCSMIHRESLNA